MPALVFPFILFFYIFLNKIFFVQLFHAVALTVSYQAAEWNLMLYKIMQDFEMCIVLYLQNQDKAKRKCTF